MKISLKSISNLFLVGLLWSNIASAVTASALVTDVKGTAFVMLNGKTQTLNIGDKIPVFADVFTEEGAELTVADYYDHKYHLSGSSHIKLERNQIELERGYFWIQSFNSKSEFMIKTANAKVGYTYGEAIVSFDPYSGKTQLMTVKGSFTLANSLETHLKVDVSKGQFSFVSNDYEKGIPRNPTSIGERSYNKITSLFNGVSPMIDVATSRYASAGNTQERSRTIASAPVVEKTVSKKGYDVICRPSSVISVKQKVYNNLYDTKMAEAKKAKAAREAKKKLTMKSNVAFKVHGISPKKATRNIASVPETIPAKADTSADIFEKSLNKQYKTQTRHPSEVNQLIEELKAFDQDYESSY